MVIYAHFALQYENKNFEQEEIKDGKSGMGKSIIISKRITL